MNLWSSSSNKTCAGWVDHWWEKPLWSRFVRAIGPGCRTGINNSGPMPVPVPARTGTDRSPRGRARSEGGVDHWSRFVARTGIVDLCISGYFCTAAGFCVFFSFIYLVCFVFNLMVLHMYNNNEGTTHYIYIYMQNRYIYIYIYIYILHIILITRIQRFDFGLVVNSAWREYNWIDVGLAVNSSWRE
jgi:hypothetical protein